MRKLSEILLKTYPYIFALLYFILLMFIDTSTLHAFQNKSFLLSSEYIKPYLYHSGGLAEYFGLLLNEILDFSIPGALLYSLLTLLSILLYRQILIKIGISKNLLLITLLPFAFIFLLTFNHFHEIEFNLKLITSLTFLNVILRISSQKIYIKSIITGFMILLWYLCGLELFVVSLIIVFIHSIKERSYIKDTIVILISSLAVLALNTYLFYTPLSSYMKDFLTSSNKIPLLLPIIYLILIICPLSVLVKIKISFNAVLQFILVTVVSFILAKTSFNEVNHSIGMIMAAGNKGNYNKVLEIRDKTLINTRIISAYTNMALLNKGQLLSRMFKYRQDGGTDGIFPSRDFDNFTAYINMRLSYDMSSINPTIRWAMESSTYLGYNTEILRHLILCHLINDNVMAAEKYYSILSKTVFHRKLKKEMDRFIRNYKNGNPDKEILQKRRLRPPQDFYSNNGNLPVNFEWALQTYNNPRAMEFYIAVCLLHNDYPRLKGIIPKMIELGYTILPVHLQEALCLFYAEGQTPPNLMSYELDRNLFQNCVWFFQTLARYNDNLLAANRELQQRTESTYWYYLYYISPITLRANR
jgi:hypothetical protein